MSQTHIFADIPKQLPEELFTTLFKNPHVHIERIVSQGHASAESFWYDQPWDEWVLVLQGQAQLAYEDQADSLLNAGDYVLITAHTKHRVAWTAAEEVTVWLAVHSCSPN
ncbi:cupin domain-containing protein [Methylovulum psychrotolerans]|uniref:cupin domain-containing protein n=1 Tax=Methylovulum psychrotolerans TaxID=1704499 RepID=UPI001BFF983D|nr:cupin domain-containing protein [Methylovulum psychrotolerans]MBT9099586.1 cupin domain-containing protein [Methylovulum psychrotolerans]